MRVVIAGLVGTLIVLGLFALMVTTRCGPPINYVRTVDGRCLKITGGGMWAVWQKEVAAAECDRRTR